MKIKFKSEDFFKEANLWWGNYYYVPVRVRFNNKIDYRLIPEELKVIYEKKFGEKILFDDQFDDWYIEEKSKLF